MNLSRYIVIAGEQERKSFNALLEILAILALKLRGQPIKEDLKPVVDAQLKDAKIALKKLGTDLKLFNKLYDNILKKSSTVEPFANTFIKDLRKRIRETNLVNNLDNMTIKQREIMNYIFTLISSPNSESAYSSLQRRISNLGSPEITRRYIQYHSETGEDPKTIKDQIESLVYKLTKRKNSMVLTPEENKKFADNDDKKQISKLRSKYSESVRQKIKQIVLDSGKSRMLVSYVMKKLKAEGAQVLPYPAVFIDSLHIYVNLDAQLCNVNGDTLNQKSLSPDFTFELNQAYNPEFTAKGKTWLYKVTSPETGNTNYIGTTTLSATNRSAKFEKVTGLLTTGEIENIKKKWRSYMNLSKLNDFNSCAAFLAEFLYQTSSRVGSEEEGGSSRGNQTFGASSFRVSAVKRPSGDTIPKKLKIIYKVKGDHNMTFTLDSTKGDSLDKAAVEKLISFIIDKCKNKKPTDLVWTIGNKRIDITAFTSWIKSHTTLTSHNFRSLRGTELALKILPLAEKEVKKAQNAIKPKKLADSAVHKIFEAAMTKVGELLGHIRRDPEGNEISTANTSIAYYVDSKTQLQWYNDVGYAPPPKVIAAARRSGVDI